MASAAASGNHRPKVDTAAQQLGAVYAKALLQAAENAGQTDALLEEFDSLLTDVLDPNPRFEAILASAAIEHDQKLGILDRTLGGRASPLLLNFLKVVSSHGRLGALRAIHGALHELYNELRGQVRVNVTTADPLDEAAAERIGRTLSQVIGGEPVVVRRTDPRLIGGLVVQVGDKLYDGSVSAQLANIRTQMIDRSVHEIQSRRDRFRTASGD